MIITNLNATKLKGLFISSKFLLAVVFIGISSCNDNNSTNTRIDDSTATTDTAQTMATLLKPQGPKPSWGPSITDPMQVVIDKLSSYGAPPLETLSAQEARKQPTPAQAV